MSRPTRERHGNTGELSSVNSKASLFLKTAYHMMTNPINMAVYGITWFHLCSLCRFGRLSRNIPILSGCLMWWIGAVGYGLWLWSAYDKHKILAVFRQLKADGNMLTVTAATTATGEKEPGEKVFAGEDVKWYIMRKAYCQIFLRDKTVFVLALQEIGQEERAFLELKLSTVHIRNKRGFKAAAGLFLAAVTLYGSFHVVRSAIPYQGELSWYLKDLRDKRSVVLRHDNVYEAGIEGILEDIRKEVDLPEKLCVTTSFNLHFAPDGKVLSLDTMLCGFDENGDFVDSYLISYSLGRSRKVSIWLHGAVTVDTYDANKDIQPLIEAVSAMPLEETVAEWSGESCYGILYYGTREWSSQEGIRYLNRMGEYRLPAADEDSFSGYSISVFCPDNDAVTPVRYLYMGYQLFAEEEAEYTADYYPEEEAEYTADYYPEKESEYTAGYYPEKESEYTTDYCPEKDVYRADDDSEAADGLTGQNSDSLSYHVRSTGNIWRTCEDYPPEEYGSIRETGERYYADKNGEKIYHYNYWNFYLKDTLPGADQVNRFLEEKEHEMTKAWQERGQWHCENETLEEDYDKNAYGDNHPFDVMEFRCLTYLDGSYCSLVFFAQHYTGGVSAFPSLCAYTIDVNTGQEAQLQQIAPHMTREEWIALIDQTFEEEQGFKMLFPNTEYEETAGECWYRFYEEEGWGSGFYLTKEGIAFYYGFGQTAWEGEGLIEVLVPWEELYQRAVELG